MPVPSSEEIKACADLDSVFKLYAQEPYMYSRESFEVDWLIYDPRSGGCILIRYLIDPSKLSCRCDGKDKMVMARLMSTGLFRTCGYCRTTGGPLPMDRLFSEIGRRRISLGEAYSHLAGGQQKPVGLPEDNSQDQHLQRLLRT